MGLVNTSLYQILDFVEKYAEQIIVQLLYKYFGIKTTLLHHPIFVCIGPSRSKPIEMVEIQRSFLRCLHYLSCMQLHKITMQEEAQLVELALET